MYTCVNLAPVIDNANFTQMNQLLPLTLCVAHIWPVAVKDH